MRRRMPSVRKYLVTGYQHRALQSLLPPEDLNVSQWAENLNPAFTLHIGKFGSPLSDYPVHQP